MDLEAFAHRKPLHRLARHERRQRAFQSGEIEFGDGHAKAPVDAHALYPGDSEYPMQATWRPSMTIHQHSACFWPAASPAGWAAATNRCAASADAACCNG